MCCEGLIYCCWRRSVLVSCGITAGGLYRQVSLLYSGGNVLCPPQNVSAPPRHQSEGRRQKICFQTRSSFACVVCWNASPAVIILTMGMKLWSNLPVCAIVTAVYLVYDVQEDWEWLELAALHYMHTSTCGRVIKYNFMTTAFTLGLILLLGQLPTRLHTIWREYSRYLKELMIFGDCWLFISCNH